MALVAMLPCRGRQWMMQQEEGVDNARRCCRYGDDDKNG
jgi:hypothetical protein